MIQLFKAMQIKKMVLQAGFGSRPPGCDYNLTFVGGEKSTGYPSALVCLREPPP